jgi:hypothetical protein
MVADWFLGITQGFSARGPRIHQTTLYESLEGVPYTPKETENFQSKLRGENKYTDLQDPITYFEAL